MYPPPSEILKKTEGTLADTPLPLLFNALSVEERTCTLELKVRALTKLIVFEDGSPVACTSNLLHESVGKFLVEKGKLTEGRYQEALNESVRDDAPITEIIAKHEWIAPFDLYKLVQQNLALKILDGFRWNDARYRILGPTADVEMALRMNPAQLVLAAVANALPFEVVATQLAFMDDQRFMLVPNPPHPLADLKLGTREAKLVGALKKPPLFSEVLSKTGMETEEAMRRLYAFAVLGIVDFAPEDLAPPAPEPVAAPPPPPVVAAAASLPAMAPVQSIPKEDDALRDALATAFLEHRAKDPYDLLGVKEDAQPAVLKKAFVALADRFAPSRFVSADLKEKAEALLVAYARAYGGLADPELAQIILKRRKAKKEAASTKKKQNVDLFKIQTQLLDAPSQFVQGKKRLDADNPGAAIEFFQFAADIEPKGQYRSYLAWAKYRANPEPTAKASLKELNEIARAEPGCEEAHHFAAEIARTLGLHDAALESYRRAFKINPDNRKYADLIRDVQRVAKIK